MLWRGFRADRIILCLLLKYVALEAQIRVTKPRAVRWCWRHGKGAWLPWASRMGPFGGSPPFEELGSAHQRGAGSIPDLLHCRGSFLLLGKNQTWDPSVNFWAFPSSRQFLGTEGSLRHGVPLACSCCVIKGLVQGWAVGTTLGITPGCERGRICPLLCGETWVQHSRYLTRCQRVKI